MLDLAHLESAALLMTFTAALEVNRPAQLCLIYVICQLSCPPRTLYHMVQKDSGHVMVKNRNVSPIQVEVEAMSLQYTTR